MNIKMLVKKGSILNVGEGSSLTNFMNVMLDEGLEFSFHEYLKDLFCSTSKKITLYNVALKSLHNIMEIKTFLRNNLELKLIKKVLFDKNQLLAFNTLSLFTYFKNLFDESENEMIMSNYDKKDFENFFNSLNVLLQRDNATDKKIINFIKTNINE